MDDTSVDTASTPVNEQKASGAQQNGEGNAGARLLSRLTSPGRYLPSFAQERLWFLNRMEPDGAFSIVTAAVRLRGALDVELLKRCLDAVVERHESLRTIFADVEGRPVQVVAPAMTLALRGIDLRAFRGPQREAELRRLLTEEAQQPFDLSLGPLARATLLKLDEDEHVLLVCTHLSVCDRPSMAILMEELAALYGAGRSGRLSPLPELPLQYGDFAHRQRERFGGQVADEQLAYWRRQLPDMPPPLELPTDRPRPPAQTFRGAERRFELDPSLAGALKELSRGLRVGLPALLFGAFALLLRRYTSQDEVLAGTPVDLRGREGTRRLIGLFTNTLVLRADFVGNPTFEDFARRLDGRFAQAHAHREAPFERLLEELRPERDTSRHPIFQVMFSVREAPPGPPEFPGLTATAVELESRATRFDLSLTWTVRGESLAACLEYNTDLFEAATAERMTKHLETLLRGVVSDPGRRVLDLPFLTTAERGQLLAEWNATGADYPRQSCLHELFEEHAAETPGAVALIYEDQQVSYAELNRRANQLAHRLRASGVGPGSVVGICMERGVEMVVGLVGILKAGAAYLPLDAAYPPERLAFMLEDARAEVILTQQHVADRVAGTRARVISVDAEWPAIARGSAENPRSGVTPEDLVYVIYTSGSTGRPKGCMLDHRGRVNNFYDYNRRFNVGGGDRLLALSSISFDMCAYDVLGTLAGGATIVMPSAARRLDPAHWADLCVRHRVTIWHSVPAMLEMLIQHVEERPELWPRRLRLALLGGDWIPVTMPDRLKALAEGVQFISLGGATEVSMDSTIYHVEATDPNWKSIPYGAPLYNQLAYVLDDRMQLLPVGVPGELHLGGVGVGWGYFGRPGLTAEKFVPNPYSDIPGDRLYKTGDLARYRPDGNLDLLGRKDFQVKIRGFRIELGEIAAALRQHPAVKQAVVIAREDEPGSKRLAAYVVPDEESAPAVCRAMRQEGADAPGGGAEQSERWGSPRQLTDEIRAHLRERLPDYMVPSALVLLEALPLTPNGKVDRRGLPRPEAARAELQTPPAAPRTPVEEVLAGIWGELLGLKQVGPDDNFFELGGHSLMATRLISRVRQLLHVELNLRTVFDAPVLSKLAAEVEAAQRAEQSWQLPPIERVPRAGEVPASYAQQRLWFLDKLVPGSAVYNIPAVIRLAGRLDLPSLERGLNEIVKRHETLRTSFAVVEERLVQVISPAAESAVTPLDLSGLPEAERESAYRRVAAEEATRPFDLSDGPLLRVRLVRLSPESHVLLVTMHHVISDGWSMDIFVRELSALYGSYVEGADSPLEELPVQYADYAAWQRQWLQGELLRAQLAYWRRQLDGAAALDLPTDRPRPAMPSYRAATQTFRLPKGLSESLKELSRREGATLYMTLLAAFQTLLHRYTGQDDILVGSPIANRNRAETEGLIGFFVNMLVMRSRLSGGTRFRELLAQVRESSLEAYLHQDVPFERLVEELQPERDLSRHPLFQVAFALQNTPESKLEVPGLRIEMAPVEEQAAKFDLTLLMEETDEGLYGSFTYSTDLFDGGTAGRMLLHLQKLLEAIASNPHQTLAELPMLTGAERQQLLFEWSGEPAAQVPEGTIPQLFEEQAARTPGAPAVVYGDTLWSYAELNARANRLARRLRSLGVGRESLVGVCAERSPEVVAGLLAILKAGGAYVPLDPTYPRERLGQMADDSRPLVILTQRHLAGVLPEHSARLLFLDEAWPDASGEDSENLVNLGHVDDLAYVIYTSGSTGRPKGTCVSHRAIKRLVLNSNYVRLTADDRVAQASNSSFDAATFEVWGALLNGALLVGITKEVALSPHEFAGQLEAGRVSALFLTTALFNQMAREAPCAFASVRHLMVGGEAVDPHWFAEVLRNGPPRRLLNVYGPTECTTFSTWHLVRDVEEGARTIPIGRPLTNTTLYVLDERMEPVPAGVAGELYIGGDGLARGYLNRPGLTAEKFVPHPFGEGAGQRLYRTGDIVRYLPDGSVEFLGRNDNQVKLRGFRVELGEIESVLLRHPAVHEATVVVREDVPGDKRLVAYVASDGTPRVGELRGHVAGSLPDYMVPAAFVLLDALPLTPNGKVDRKALPAPDWDASCVAESTAAPSTPVEELLADIWCGVLGLGRVGARDNFFELGGHSLLATQVASRVREVFGVEMPVRVLFERATVEGEAEWVEEALRGGAAGAERLPIEKGMGGEVSPLSFAQQRLWFLSQLEPDNPFYNVPLAIRLSGHLIHHALERVLDKIVRRHEALRTTFETRAGQPVQVVAPHSRLRVRVTHLEHLPSGEREAEAERLAREEARRPFDLGRGPLLRAKLLRLSEDEHVLLLTMHHIVSDGWSVGVLIREMTALYRAFVAGDESPLAEPPIQYGDYAAWQREWLTGEVLEGQLSYWRKQLADAPAVLELPTDRPRPPVQSYRGATYAFTLPAGLSKGLNRLSRQEGVTLFMTLMAAWQTLLSRYSGQDDIVVGTPVANRNRAETEGLIGCFLNTLAIRGDLSGNPSFGVLLRQVRETALAAFANQDVPFEMLVEELQPERNLSHTPIFQVMFTLHNAPMPGTDLGGLTLNLTTVETGTSKLDLVLNITEEERGLVGFVEYNTDLFEGATVERMMQHFQTLLAGVVARPDRALSEQPLLTEAEEQRLTVSWNDTREDYPPPHCVHQLFERQAEATPDAPAVIFEGESLSYRELNERANRLAHSLRRRGVGSGDRVGLFLEHSPETVVAVLGTLKVGAAYVPLDPEHPKSRIAFVLEDAGVPVVLTQRRLAGKLPESTAALLCLDDEWEAVAGESGQNPRHEVTPSDLAYVIYTSGSTGQPKGVKIAHGSLNNYVRWAAEVYVRGERASFALYSSLAFDLTVTSIYTPLVTGNSLHVYRREERETPLFRILRDGRVNVLKLTPSHLTLIKELDNGASGVRRLIVGGEALTTQLARKVYESFGGRVEIFNEYGPTEATVGCMIHRFDPERDVRAAVPIGRPAANTRIYVLDDGLKPAAENVVGELYIAGAGLAQGYLNRDDLTRERFLPDPFVVGERMYRSGDLARRLCGGLVEYLGRGDEQVKFHGYRVELNEIRGALNRHPQVTDSVVLLAKDEAGNDHMAAYYVAAQELEPAQLREWLAESIIEETIPNLFARLDALPLTVNGKIDYAALPRVEEVRRKGRAVRNEARTQVEELLAGIWAEVLGMEPDQIGTGDSFFELGGHSLLGILVVSRVREVFRIELPVRSLFQAPTIAKLAARVESHLREGAGLEQLPIESVGREEPLPLSFAQQRLWFLSQLEPDNPFYNVPLAIRLSGHLFHNALEQVLDEIVRRHEVLRTTFETRAGQPVQMIAPHSRLRVRVTHLEHLPADEREAEAERLAREEARRPFDLGRGPLLRAKLLRLSEDEHVLLLTMHHIVSDAWSMGVLIREMTALYRAFVAGARSPLPELQVQYGDYAAWQRKWLSAEVLEGQLSYWRRQLAGASGVLELPGDRPRPPVQSYRGAIMPVQFPRELTERLRALSQQSDTTLFMTLLTAFDVLLFRYTGQEDILVASPTANRNRPEIEGLIGFFVNALVMRADLSGDPTFEELLARVREVAVEAYANQDVPFERLVEELQPARDMSRHPLFQVVFSLQDASLDKLTLPGLRLKMLPVDNQTSMFDLTLLMEEKEEGLGGIVQYNTDLFDASTVERMMGCFRILLEGIAADPRRRVSSLPLLREEERERLLEQWSHTSTDYGRDKTLPQVFEEQAALRPDAPALSTHDGLALSYAELNARANRLAHFLRARRLPPDSLVALHLDRSADLVVAVLATLKAGAAYLPLDTSYPERRLRSVMAGARPAFLLTQESLAGSLAGGEQLPSLRLDSEWPSLSAGFGDENPPAAGDPDSLAYVMYTSGSTGEPKGIAVPHRAVLRLVRSTNYAEFSADEVFLQLAPVSFDASTFEVWGALLNGARLAVMAPGTPSLAEIGATLVEQKVTTLWLTASLFHLMVDEQLERMRGLRQLLAGGDVLSPSHVRRALSELPGCRVVNGYGPTENTTFTCCHVMTEEREVGEVVPIGRPIANTRVYVLDAALRPVPVGVAGELYAGGDGLARGYHRAPSLTAERFVPDPVGGEGGARLYRTGDVVRYRADGTLEFLGRRDEQVKVRGYRIELGEVEAVLGAHEAVRQAVVVAKGEGAAKRLVGYYVAEGERGAGAAELRAYMKERVPDYMVPSAFVSLEALPVTANGKVDRRALPEPEWGVGSTEERVGARTPAEELLCGIWGEVLGGGTAAEVGVRDNFFELGGHSLLATQVASRVREVFGVEMPVRVLFERATVEGEAEWVEEALRGGAAGAEQLPMERVGREGPLPLSFAQQRLWFLEQLSPGTLAYNICTGMTFKGSLDLAALERSLGEIVRRHEILRTTFALDGEQPVQVVGPAAEISLPPIDLSGETEAEREGLLRLLVREGLRRPFDLTEGPLLRAKLLRLSGQEHALLLFMHHIVTDGWSEGVLLDELRALYAAFSAGEPSPLPELAVQYADFAVWQRRWLQGEALEKQLTYWKRRLEGVPEALELPTDKPRPPMQSYEGARQSFFLSEELTRGLKSLCRREGVTLFMALLAALQTLLSRYSGQEELVVGSPVAGRNRAGLERMVGFFVNTLALRTDLSGDPTFGELLRRVREVALGAYEHQDLPFEKLVEELNLERDLSRTPLFQVFFNLLNASGVADGEAAEGFDLLTPPPVTEPAPESTKFDLTLYALNRDRDIRLDIVYSTDLFEAATAVRMFEHLRTLLEGVVADPSRRLSTLPVIPEEERRQLLGRRNVVGPRVAFEEFTEEAAGRTLVERFEEQARLRPQNVAVKTARHELTYAALDELAGRIASRIRGLPERVCLLFEHDAPMVAGLLAALKAGKTYVPLDPLYPEERLAFMLADAQAGAILTNGANLAAARRSAGAGVEVVNVDDLDAPAEGDGPGAAVLPETAAYILYTSGSAGQPKGVVQSHRNVLRHIRAYTNALHINPSDRLTLLSSYSFDAAVMDIFGALLNGATLCPYNIKEEGLEQFAGWLVERGITVYHSTPTVYRYFTNALRGDEDFSRIRLVVLGGEEVFRRDFERYREAFSPGCVFVNGLGPTESTLALQYMLDKGSQFAGNRVPVGYPVEGTEVLLLNEHREEVAAYAAGEIAIRSEQVALGYWRQPELTRQAFAEDGGARTYYTGDLGRLLPDGSVEFIGRRDFQVKVRGYKIDSSEIETRLRAQPGVREAVVNAVEKAAGERQLVAYLIPEAGPPLDPAEVRRSLSEQLPDYMVPAAFVLLDSLPLTPTGKLDRRALPAPDWTGSQGARGAEGPRTPVEEVLADIWGEVLGVEPGRLGVRDNFFERGGHSLLATLVVSRVREAFGIKFPLRMIFRAPTIAGLADAVLESLIEQGDSEHAEQLLREVEQL